MVWEVLREEGMATHSSIPALRIPGTKEPGGLESRGLQRVRYHWSYEARRSNGGELWLQTLSPQECLGECDKIRLNPHHTYRPPHDPQLKLILSPHPRSPPCSWTGRFDMKRSIVYRFIYTLNTIPILCQQILFPLELNKVLCLYRKINK